MKLVTLLRCTDGTQNIRVLPFNSRKPLYEGKAFDCDLENRGVYAIYTSENVLVIEVEF